MNEEGKNDMDGVHTLRSFPGRLTSPGLASLYGRDVPYKLSRPSETPQCFPFAVPNGVTAE